MRIITCQVNSGAGCSVWQYLKGCHGCSRRFLNRLKQGRGSLFLGGAPVESVARTLLREGDTLSLVLEEETVNFIPNAALSAPVVYEDEDLVVFNKPPGMPVHPSHRHLEDTLANLFAARCLKKGEAAGFHPINRLDRDTSGLCVVAKHALAAAALSGGVEKVYYAVAEGDVAPPDGFIKQPIARAGKASSCAESRRTGNRRPPTTGYFFAKMGTACLLYVFKPEGPTRFGCILRFWGIRLRGTTSTAERGDGLPVRRSTADWCGLSTR